MHTPNTRRDFLKVSSLIASSTSLLSSSPAEARNLNEPALSADDGPIKVVVWDERQPAQKQAYANFLGNAIAEHLRAQSGVAVKSVGLGDPGQGLAEGVLDDCHVLIWWGHVRQAEIKPEVGLSIVEKIKAGKLSLVALYSAHWSTPFVEAMNERTRLDVGEQIRADGIAKVDISYVPPPKRYTTPTNESRLTPYATWCKFPDGAVKASVNLPYCCFPSYREDGKPSHVKVLRPDHPIVIGIPREFEISQTEMYNEPFHVPEPDEVILEERWASGEWFRSGAIWRLGRGRVFYFRPGHETYPVYKETIPLKIITNAVRWLGSETT